MSEFLDASLLWHRFFFELPCGLETAGFWKCCLGSELVPVGESVVTLIAFDVKVVYNEKGIYFI